MKYITEDTIAVLSTAAGKSAIAVIRLSGKQSFSIVEKVFKPSSLKTERSSQVQHGFIVDGDNRVDEVLCTSFKAPNTYTGENIVEISTHGNPVIIKEVLDLLYKNGARAAGPGEFTYRAYLNGKKDLAEAEAVCALITGKTKTSVKAALNNVSGGFSDKVNSAKDILINMLAYLEASLDYPQEDIPFLNQDQKEKMIKEVITVNKTLLDIYKVSNLLQKGLKVAIIGKPNAGKSSLLNAILGKNRAIVTEIAGTTTDTIEEVIDCNGIPLTIIDTAGIRQHSENSIELLGQERTKETVNRADLIIWVFDSSSSLDSNDKQIAEYLKSAKINIPIIAVLNKSDLPSSIDKTEIKKMYSFKELISISSKNNKNILELLKTISEIAGISENQNEYLMINTRHNDLLLKADSALKKAEKIIFKKNEDEVACFELRNALSAYEEILGINIPHDILDTIFGSFCIGK